MHIQSQHSFHRQERGAVARSGKVYEQGRENETRRHWNSGMAGIKVTRSKNLQRNTLRGQILKHALISIMLFLSVEAGTISSIVSQFRDTELFQITTQ